MNRSIDDLVEKARDSGLDLFVEDDKLVVQGLKSAKVFALQLIDRKPEVVEFLDDERRHFHDWSSVPLEASVPCSKCGSFMPWWDVYGYAHCPTCDPPLYSAPDLREKAGRLRDSADGST